MKNETAAVSTEVKKRKKFHWTRDDSELALLGLPTTIRFAGVCLLANVRPDHCLQGL